jgi:membrane-bound lytic murein transglycosylase D
VLFRSGRPGGLTAEPDRGRLTGFDIPVVINPAVEQYLELLQGSGRTMFSRWLARTTRYGPLIRPILRKHGVPEDLLAVALVESGLKFSALSRAKAVGPWQFMEATGKAYGLKAGFWLDERRDFLKATDAAARHLKDLYTRFGDWYLAWAAYNTGERRVIRALQRTGASDFWGIRESALLAAETKRYVPKIIAAALIAKNPERYGFHGIDWLPPLTWDELEVPGPINLKAVARAVGVELEVIQELNPELRFWCTPPDLERYRLRIPKDSRARFAARYRPLARDMQLAYTRHRLQAGETLSHVALRHQTSVQALLSANRIRDPRRVRAGTNLIVPVRPCGTQAPKTAAADPAGSK